MVQSELKKLKKEQGTRLLVLILPLACANGFLSLPPLGRRVNNLATALSASSPLGPQTAEELLKARQLAGQQRSHTGMSEQQQVLQAGQKMTQQQELTQRRQQLAQQFQQVQTGSAGSTAVRGLNANSTGEFSGSVEVSPRGKQQPRAYEQQAPRRQTQQHEPWREQQQREEQQRARIQGIQQIRLRKRPDMLGFSGTNNGKGRGRGRGSRAGGRMQGAGAGTKMSASMDVDSFSSFSSPQQQQQQQQQRQPQPQQYQGQQLHQSVAMSPVAMVANGVHPNGDIHIGNGGDAGNTMLGGGGFDTTVSISEADVARFLEEQLPGQSSMASSVMGSSYQGPPSPAFYC
jgi:hypothetical protein